MAVRRNSGYAGSRVFVPYEKEEKGPSWFWIGILAFMWPVGTVISAVLLGKKLKIAYRKKKQVDYRNYAAVIGDRCEVDVREIAAKMGKEPSQVYADLQTMIDKGYMGHKAYLDRGQGILILDVTEVENARREAAYRTVETVETVRTVRTYTEEPEAQTKAREKTAPAAQKKVRNDVSERIRPEARGRVQNEDVWNENEFEIRLREIQRLNDEIADEAVSRRIDEIGRLTASIFSVVRQNPERQDEVRKFMNYYLPTTFKLLQSYALMEKQAYQGENIANARKRIEGILDSLIVAFRKQLDQLFRTDAIDVDADIRVLETMMAKDGLVNPRGELHPQPRAAASAAAGKEGK